MAYQNIQLQAPRNSYNLIKRPRRLFEMKRDIGVSPLCSQLKQKGEKMQRADQVPHCHCQMKGREWERWSTALPECLENPLPKLLLRDPPQNRESEESVIKPAILHDINIRRSIRERKQRLVYDASTGSYREPQGWNQHLWTHPSYYYHFIWTYCPPIIWGEL